MTSRNAKDLLPWFPELGQAARALPAGTVLDGEIVIADEDGTADFGALQDRLVQSPRQLARRSSSHVTVLVVFDLLALRGGDVLDLALSERRTELGSLLPGLHPCLQLIEQTANIEMAREWVAHVPMLEGVVAKRVDGRYRPGTGGWVKVKRQRTADLERMAGLSKRMS